MTTRADTISSIVEEILQREPGHPTRVAVDGITAAGKTTLAAELAAAVRGRGQPATHLSTDDWHHVAERRRRDPDRARGYYRDAYDLAAFDRLVLQPLGPGGDRRYVPRRHDLATDAVLHDEPVRAAAGEIVVVDGSFLQGPPLRGHWDVIIWVDTSTTVAQQRASVRDLPLFGSAAAVLAAYRERYHPACALYTAEWDPASSAHAVVANDDPERATVSFRARPC